MQLLTIHNDQPIGAEINSADARELHTFLNSEQQYADWIKNRISQYGFIENQDYIVKTTYTGRRPRKEYFITLDMAKELCMVENNERGKEARRYFIKCEQELQALKVKYYVDEISNLRAVQISQGRHNQNVINGYKSQLSQRNALIAKLRATPTGFKDLYLEASAQRDYFRRKYNEIYELLKFDKGECIAVALAKIQKELERVYSGIGAVMAYANEGDRYFLEHNEITKG